jgi:hypothetical protein
VILWRQTEKQIITLRALRVITGLAFLLSSVPAFPHHSFTAEYDSGKPFTITGTVNRLEWKNPHVFLYLDVKDPAANVVTWEFEMGSPNGLLHRGWTRNTAKAGDTITIDAYPSKGTPHLANARLVTLSDGRKLHPVAPDDTDAAK